jgi:hypothetical protein
MTEAPRLALRTAGVLVALAGACAPAGGEQEPAGIPAEPPRFDIPRLKGVTIDGKADDWMAGGGAEATRRGFAIELLHRALKDGRWQARGGADIRLAWDRQGLLVLARLADDRWVEARQRLWRYDSLELYVADRRGSRQVYQVVVSPGMSAAAPALRLQIHDHRAEKRGELSAAAARARDGRACTIEVRLPWSNLGIAPEVGGRAALQVMVNDNDEPNSPYEKTTHDAWYPKLGAFMDSKRMHALRLAAEAGSAYRAAAGLHVRHGRPPAVRIDAAPALAGRTARARADGNVVAEAALAALADAPACTARLSLEKADADRVVVEVDGQPVGAVRLYRGLPADVRRAIRQAGNADSERQRYRLLSGLLKREDLSALLRRDLQTLLPVIDWWANGREKLIAGRGGRAAENGYLCRFFYGKVKPGNDWPGAVRADSPLYPIRAYYRGRALLWVPIQSGGIRRDPTRRERYYRPARRCLRIAHEAFGENPVIGMYVGQPPAWPNAFPPDPRAPAWANLQREGLEKLAELIHWWIDHRQVADGQFGGGWGDDVEMWRWWTPLLVGFRDAKIVAAQSRLSRAILSQAHMKHGYTSRMSDVEHTAEDTGDSITPMIFLEPDNAAWRARALRIVELARQRWMGENERGFLQFKSTYFNAHEVDRSPKRACDTVYHPRALHPALIHWLRTGDERVGRLVARWMDTWVDAAAREENGKPAGIVPSAVHWPDGQVGGGVEPWWRPQNYPNDLYAWPSAMSLMTRTMLLTYHLTGREKYLQPIRSMARIRMKYLRAPPEGEPKPGSAAWCAVGGGRFGSGMRRFLPATLAKYRLLTGDAQFDALLKADAGGYMKMRLGLGRDALVAGLRRNAEAFRINRPAYTSEMRWTDRVLTFNDRWGNEGNGWGWPTPNPAVLYATATGDPADPRYFPLNAVRWLIEPRAFAALVTATGRERFEAELYNFRDEPRAVAAELYLLSEGPYAVRLTGPDGKTLQREAVRVAGSRTRIRLELPPRKLCRLSVAPQPASAASRP